VGLAVASACGYEVMTRFLLLLNRGLPPLFPEPARQLISGLEMGQVNQDPGVEASEFELDPLVLE